MPREVISSPGRARPLPALTVSGRLSHPWVAMEVETKFVRLFKPAALGHRIDGWRVCWIGGWDKCRVLFVVMVERPNPHCSTDPARGKRAALIAVGARFWNDAPIRAFPTLLFTSGSLLRGS